MEDMNLRFIQVRKSLSLTQKGIGDALGLSNSGISNIENGTRNVTDKHLKLLASIFNVNENWMRTGKDSMFLETDQSIVENLKEQYHMTDNQKKLMDIFLSMSSEKREQVAQAFFNFVNEAQQLSTTDQAVEPAQRKISTDIKRATVNSELDAESKGKIS